MLALEPCIKPKKFSIVISNGHLRLVSPKPRMRTILGIVRENEGEQRTFIFLYGGEIIQLFTYRSDFEAFAQTNPHFPLTSINSIDLREKSPFYYAFEVGIVRRSESWKAIRDAKILQDWRVE